MGPGEREAEARAPGSSSGQKSPPSCGRQECLRGSGRLEGLQTVCCLLGAVGSGKSLGLVTTVVRSPLVKVVL